MAFASSGRSDATPQKPIMEEAAQKLKRIRERLGLKYRDVEEATARIASAHHSDEFLVSLSRLSDIENKGTMPTMYRLYSLCAVYRLDVVEVLSWYGILLSDLPADAALLEQCPWYWTREST
jgi:transcriptional regulator with XRE-family HTH domain